MWVEGLHTKRKVNAKGTNESGVKNKAWSIGARGGARGSSYPPPLQEERPGWVERENLTSVRERDGRTSYLTASVFVMIRKRVHFSGLIKCQSRVFRVKVEV